MRVLVCGSRTFGYKADENGNKIHDDFSWQLLYYVLNGVLAAEKDLTVFAGGAPGADEIAKEWAIANKYKNKYVDFVETKADWTQYGRAAGPMRNQIQLDRMLAVEDDYLGLAFVDKQLELSKGTFDMVKKLRKANIDTAIIQAFK